MGLTPKEMVWTLNKAKLYRYDPTRPAEERHPVPLLLVYALINKPFIFDLAPDRSFVEYMVDQGSTCTCSIGARPALKTGTHL